MFIDLLFLHITRWGCFNNPTQGRSTMLKFKHIKFVSIPTLDKARKKTFNFEFGECPLVTLHTKI